jgi:hypothetical protein
MNFLGSPSGLANLSAAPRDETENRIDRWSERRTADVSSARRMGPRGQSLPVGGGGSGVYWKLLPSGSRLAGGCCVAGCGWRVLGLAVVVVVVGGGGAVGRW